MPSAAPRQWTFNPASLRTPSVEEWRSMSATEREQVEDALCWAFAESQQALPQGEPHGSAAVRTQDALRAHFDESGRRIYIGTDMVVLYPTDDMFAPDVFVVLDVEDDLERSRWNVEKEGKGLDLCIEIVWRGSQTKDMVRNVELYAQLGIHEYFVFDLECRVLKGYRLSRSPGPYMPLLPKKGRLWSEVLNLDLAIDEGQLRFYHGDSSLLHWAERIATLNAAAAQATERIEAERALTRAQAQRAEAAEEREQVALVRAQAAEKREQVALVRAQKEAQRAQKEARRAQKEAQRAQKEAQRATLAEQQLAEALAMIASQKRN